MTRLQVQDCQARITSTWLPDQNWEYSTARTELQCRTVSCSPSILFSFSPSLIFSLSFSLFLSFSFLSFFLSLSLSRSLSLCLFLFRSLLSLSLSLPLSLSLFFSLPFRLCAICCYGYSVEIKLTYTDHETRNEKLYSYLTHLTRDPRFSHAKWLRALEPGFQCGAAKGGKSANSRFFSFMLGAFSFWRFLFFALPRSFLRRAREHEMCKKAWRPPLNNIRSEPHWNSFSLISTRPG